MCLPTTSVNILSCQVVPSYCPFKHTMTVFFDFLMLIDFGAVNSAISGSRFSSLTEKGKKHLESISFWLGDKKIMVLCFQIKKNIFYLSCENKSINLITAGSWKGGCVIHLFSFFVSFYYWLYEKLKKARNKKVVIRENRRLFKY